MLGLEERELLRRVTHLECEGCGFQQPVQLADWFEFIDDVRLETRLMKCECPNPAGAPLIISHKPLIGLAELDEEHQDGPTSWRYIVDEGLLQLLRARGVTV